MTVQLLILSMLLVGKSEQKSIPTTLNMTLGKSRMRLFTRQNLIVWVLFLGSMIYVSWSTGIESVILSIGHLYCVDCRHVGDETAFELTEGLRPGST